MRTLVRVVALGIALSACASMSPTTLTKLAKLDVLTIRPGNLSVAAVMPVPLRLRTGDIVLRFALDAPPPYGPVDETMRLVVASAEEAPGIGSRSGFERVQVAHIAPADLARLEAAQTRAAAHRKSGSRGGKGSLSVAIVGGCRDGELTQSPLIAAIYLRTSPSEKYFPLVASLDIRKTVGDDATLAKLPPCRPSE